MRGFGGRQVLELRASDEHGTYRAVYTVRIAGAIYVLHAFQKKSHKGIKTDKEARKEKVGGEALFEIW